MSDIVEQLRDGEPGSMWDGAREILRLRAENEKLRAALKRIAEQDAVEMALDPQWARRAAAAALKETGDD